LQAVTLNVSCFSEERFNFFFIIIKIVINFSNHGCAVIGKYTKNKYVAEKIFQKNNEDLKNHIRETKEFQNILCCCSNLINIYFNKIFFKNQLIHSRAKFKVIFVKNETFTFYHRL
jgi:hypothetical protein